MNLITLTRAELHKRLKTLQAREGAYSAELDSLARQTVMFAIADTTARRAKLSIALTRLRSQIRLLEAEIKTREAQS